MSAVLQLLLLGLGTGALYALAALGMVLVYRSSGVVNFAHGGVGMLATFVFYELQVGRGWTTPTAALVAVGVGALLGLLCYVVAVRLPRGASSLTSVIATLALLLIIQGGAALHYGTTPNIVQQFLPHDSVDFGAGVTVGADRIALLLIAVGSTVLLTVLYRRTRFGLATTAVSESPANLAALGWRIGKCQGR